MPTRRRWKARPWRHDDSSPSWTSGALAITLTFAAFAVAFVAMTSVRLRDFNGPTRDAVAVVRLSPPVERPDIPKPRPSTRTRPPSVAPPPRDAPIAPERKLPTDTAVGAPVSAPTPLTPGMGRDTARASGVGGGSGTNRFGTAGVTLHSDLSPAARDSLAASVLKRVSPEEWKKPLTPQELAEVRARREPGLAPNARAARLPGENVYAPLMSGGYAVGHPVVSISVMGKSAAERRRDSVLVAEYRARLDRLQEVLRQRRLVAAADSLLRDSLVRDSLRRLARRP